MNCCCQHINTFINSFISNNLSAKDPVNMAGFMIDNIAKGTLKQWHLEDMAKISKDKDVELLDVRTVGEFSPA